MAKKQRLDKAIAMQGALSRSEVKTLIRKGEVTVNGQVVKSADFGVDFDSDTIAVQGRELTLRQHLYLMMNKPKGWSAPARTGMKGRWWTWCPSIFSARGCFRPEGSTRTPPALCC